MTDATNAARVLLVEDEPLTRLMLRTTLHQATGYPFKVIGELGTGQEALDWLDGHPGQEEQPDVILMDVGLPQMDGIEATAAIKRRWPSSRVVMLTSREQPETLMASFQSGAQAYCLKETPGDLLCTILQQTIQGACWVDPKLAHVLLGHMVQTGAIAVASQTTLAEKNQTGALLGLLTEREMDILRLLAQGKTNQDMADGLVLSLNTIKTHLKNIFSKLGVNDRTEAALLAARQGLG